MVIAKPRRVPPPALVDFPKPSCTVCGRRTRVDSYRQRFRCYTCACWWDIDTAHLFPGEWDQPYTTRREVTRR